FRRNDPAVFGVEVLEGRLKQKSNVMNETGKTIGSIHQIQNEGKTVSTANRGDQVAVSMSGPTIGRQVNEGDVLYTLPGEQEVRTINQKYLQLLSEEDKQLLKEIITVRRKASPLYGY
ncbi:MAG: translation initiation factor IF-2, partial [Thaumarchaeota archaeon]|nr:translation initiation factor IF-2 [Nitrososphaerota archaeon]